MSPHPSPLSTPVRNPDFPAGAVLVESPSYFSSTESSPYRFTTSEESSPDIESEDEEYLTCGQRPAPRTSPTSDAISINSDTTNNFATLVASTQYRNLEQSLISAEQEEMEQHNPEVISLIIDLGQLQGASRTRAELAILGAEKLCKRLLKEAQTQPKANRKQPPPGASLQPPEDSSQQPLISRFPTPPPVKRTRNNATSSNTATGPRRTPPQLVP